MAAHLDQAQIVALDRVVAVVAGPADMRGGDKLALGGVAPRVIGAADRALDLARLGHEDHAAVAADVLEDAHVAVLVADQQQRHAEKVHRHGIARLRHVRRNGQPGPLREQQRLLFLLEDGFVDIMSVGQAVGLVTDMRTWLRSVTVAVMTCLLDAELRRRSHERGPMTTDLQRPDFSQGDNSPPRGPSGTAPRAAAGDR